MSKVTKELQIKVTAAALGLDSAQRAIKKLGMEAVNAQGAGVIGGDGNVKRRKLDFEQRVRNEQATRVRAMRDAADREKVREEVERRLFGATRKEIEAAEKAALAAEESRRKNLRSSQVAGARREASAAADGSGGLAGVGKLAAILFTVEKVNQIAKRGSEGVKEWAEGTITANQALAKALDPIPIVGALDEVAEAIGAVIKHFDGSIERAKRFREEAAQIRFNEETKKFLAMRREEAIGAPAKAIRERGTPGELLQLRAAEAEARKVFRNQFGIDPEKFNFDARPDTGTPNLLRTMGNEQMRQEARRRQEEFFTIQRRLRDQEADFDAEQRRNASRPGFLDGMFGAVGGRLRDFRGQVGEGVREFAGNVRERFREAQRRRLSAEEELADSAFDQARAAAAGDPLAVARLDIERDIVEERKRLLDISRDETLSVEQRDRARQLLGNLDQLRDFRLKNAADQFRDGRESPNRAEMESTRFLTGVGPKNANAKIEKNTDEMKKWLRMLYDFISRRAGTGGGTLPNFLN